jgi:hypothetical protein
MRCARSKRYKESLKPDMTAGASPLAAAGRSGELGSARSAGSTSLAAGQQRHALHRVGQLPDVAGPGVPASRPAPPASA